MEKIGWLLLSASLIVLVPTIRSIYRNRSKNLKDSERILPYDEFYKEKVLHKND